MKVFWRVYGGETIFLLIIAFVILSVPTPTQGVRWSMCLNQSQVEEVLKRFKTRGSYEYKLKQILDCLGDNKLACRVRSEYLTNEIHLRLQMRERGEECTSAGNYSKPFYEIIVQSSPDENYRRFQEELLDTGLTFCNPFKHLYCSPQKKCECRPGTVLKPDVKPDVCNILVPGGYCVDPGLKDVVSNQYTNALYDPFNPDRLDFGYGDMKMIISPPQCLEAKGCRTLDYFHRSICANDVILELDKKLVDHFKDLPRLSFGDPCNSEHHEELLKSPEAEWSDYTIRVKKLEEIMGAKTQLCDLRRLLVCGNSGKCECLKPSFYDEKTKNCTYKHPHELCAQTFIMRDFATNLTGNASRDVMAGYDSIQGRDCPGVCVVFTFTRVLCSICHIQLEPGMTGRNCDKNLTSFLTGQLPQIALPSDEPDWGKQVDLLTELSDKAIELEKIQKLEEGSSCDLQGELKAARVIRRIKILEVEGTMATKADYRDIIRFTDTVIRQYGARGLCKYPERKLKEPVAPSNIPSVIVPPRPDLVCGPTATNPKCYKPNDVEYLEILKKRLIPFQTITEGQPCPIDVDKLFENAMSSYGTEYQTNPRYHQFLIVLLETYFVNETQFCNSKCGLKCPGYFPFASLLTTMGKCTLSEEMKKKNKMKECEDLRANNAPHFIPVSFVDILVILFILSFNSN